MQRLPKRLLVLLLLALGLALTTLRRGEVTILIVILVILIALTTELQEKKEEEKRSGSQLPRRHHIRKRLRQSEAYLAILIVLLTVLATEAIDAGVTGEPVDGVLDDLLLERHGHLKVELHHAHDLRRGLLALLDLGRGEEVEERATGAEALLDALGQVLALLPVDLSAVDALADNLVTLLAVTVEVVGLADDLVGEEGVFPEVELEGEAAGLLLDGVLRDVGEVLEGLLVLLGDGRVEHLVVLERGEPELGHADDVLLLLGLLLYFLLLLLLLDLLDLGLGILLLIIGLLLGLLVGGLNLTVDDGRSLLVERGELLLVVLELEGLQLLLELLLNLLVLAL